MPQTLRNEKTQEIRPPPYVTLFDKRWFVTHWLTLPLEAKPWLTVGQLLRECGTVFPFGGNGVLTGRNVSGIRSIQPPLEWREL